MALTPEQLVAELQAKPLHAIYLVAGAETLRVQEAADAIRARARADGFAERVVYDVDDRFDWNTLRYELSAPSLFAPRRLFDLRLATGKPGRDGAQALERLCDDLAADTLVLICAGDWSNKHGGRWSECIAKAGAVVLCPQLRASELPAWLGRRLSARGLSANREAIDVLVERVEGNLLAAAQEVDKLALLAPGARLDAPAMAQAVADSARYNVFGLLESALAGDAARALRMSASLCAEGDSVLALMGWVAAEVRRIAGYAAVAAAGADVGSAMRADRVWDSRQALYRRALQRHSAVHWERFVGLCAQIDRIAKGRADGDPWQVLDRL
ncbi:MAG: DNA polymerase III subunit delta, partial [Lysobacterales bacterium CG17_big_fil_post_rev_8_21_14_2_50_64_11]